MFLIILPFLPTDEHTTTNLEMYSRAGLVAFCLTFPGWDAM